MGSRYASNLYAGRFRFRRGYGGGGGGGGRRFYGRKYYQDRSIQEDENRSDGNTKTIEEKHERDAEINKPPIRTKKYSKNRKAIVDGAAFAGDYGRLKRSSSLPCDVSLFLRSP